MKHTTLSNCVRLIALSALLSGGAIQAAEFYAAPNGRSSGNGSISSPWDLSTALAGAGGSIHVGDTIWLRGGTYIPPTSNGFNSTLAGTVSAPVIVRNYQGERATLDGHGCEYTLTVNGGYVWFWGLEIMDSNTLRVTSQTNGAHPNAYGVGVYAPNVRFINNVVHDTAEGFSAYNLSNDSIFYGNLSYYNGYIGPDRNHGHGYYMQNIIGTKFLVDNLASDNADEGFQIYGSGSANVVGFRLFGNVSFNNSSWPFENYQYNYIIAGGNQRKDIQIDQNFSFFTPSANYGFNAFGQYTYGDDMSITNNVFAGGAGGPEVHCQGGPLVFTGNKSYVQPGGLDQMRLELCPGQTIAGWTWDNNTYYGKTNFYDGSMLDFVSWQVSTGFDAHSTMTPNAPTGKWIYVRPNQYESKRANIVIYNWDLSNAVPVDLSGVLAVGDPFVIQDTQNFFGPPVASGTYSGGPISVPMTGLSKAVPSGFATPPHSAPLFGTFVVMSSNSTTGTSVFVSPASTNLGPNQQQQFSATVQGNSNQSVTWSMTGLGSISPTGLYTAPATISGTPTVTVTATSVADPTKSATVTLNLSAASISVSLSPSGASLAGGQQQQFTATVTGNSNQSVTWSLSGVGTLTNGLYTAPSSISSPQSATITATSVADSSKSVQATVTLNPPVSAPTWPTPSQSVTLYQEAEAGGLAAPMAIAADASASGGHYASTPTSNAGTLSLTFNLPTAGTYGLWGRITCADSSSDSFIVSVDGGTTDIWDTCEGVWSPNWQWRLAVGRGPAGTTPAAVNPRLFTLTAGTHTFVFAGRDPNTKLDLVALTNDPRVAPIVPVGKPGTAQFVKNDSTTQGSWKGTYGADGYNVIGDSAQSPSYASLTPSGQSFYAWAASTTDTRGLVKPSSVTDRIEATWYSATSFTLDLNFTDTTQHQVAFYCLDWENAGRSQTVDILDGSTGGLLDSQNLSEFSGGRYLVWNLSGHVTVRFTRTGSKNAVVGGIFFGAAPVVVSSTATSAAQFIKTDSMTQGNWKGVYGGDGYNVIGDLAQYPAYASLTPNAQSFWAWANSTTEVRGLQKVSASDRIEAVWYSPTSFTLDLNLSDTVPHQVAFYSLDWENAGRAETVDILDAGTGALLDSQILAGFSGGKYLVWNITGHVTVRFTSTGRMNAVLDGVFFGAGSSGPPPPPPTGLGNAAQFVKIDAATAGNWKGVYGADGYTIVADSANNPSYATVTPGAQQQWTWAASTADPRGLQQASSSSRIEATWYSPTTFTVDVNITDGQAHRVAFYCLDFENAGRAQTVTIYDAQTNAVLDFRTLSSFSNGQYMVWNLSGHVIVRFSRTGGNNAVTGGVFFN